MHRHPTPLTASLVAALALVPASAGAQDVRYTTVTRAEFGGALGRMMKLVGSAEPVTEVTYIRGDRLRADHGEESSTITDAAAGTLTWLDHTTKTYVTLNLGEMTAAAARTMAAAMAGAPGGGPAGAPSAEEEAGAEEAGAEEAGAEEPEVAYEVHLSTERTGKRKKILGSPAEEVLLTLEIVATEVGEEPQDSSLAGTLVVLGDLWLSQEFPGYLATRRMEDAWRASWQASAVGSDAAGMERAYAVDPRIGRAAERLQEELRELEGMPLRSTIHFVVVPPGVEFDRKQALKDADRSLAGDAAGAAAGAAKGAVRGIAGGLFGKKKRQEEAGPKQATVMRVTTEVTEVETGPLPDELFAPPPGYTERKLEPERP